MSATVKRTQAELVAEMKLRFGEKQRAWAFICPACKLVTTAQQMKDALDAAGSKDDAFQHLGQICIGRVKNSTTGCDWAAFGLFRGPEFVIMPDGREVASFAIAPSAL